MKYLQRPPDPPTFNIQQKSSDLIRTVKVISLPQCPKHYVASNRNSPRVITQTKTKKTQFSFLNYFKQIPNKIMQKYRAFFHSKGMLNTKFIKPFIQLKLGQSQIKDCTVEALARRDYLSDTARLL